MKRYLLPVILAAMMAVMLLVLATTALAQEKGPADKGAVVGHLNIPSGEGKCHSTQVNAPSGATHGSVTCNQQEPTFPGETTFFLKPNQGSDPCTPILLTNPGDALVFSG